MEGFINDREWMESIKQGNPQAFGKLYDRYAPLLYGIILKIVADKKTAEDILQHSFLTIRESLKNSTDYTDFTAKPLLYRMMNIARTAAFKAKSAESVKSVASMESTGGQNLVYAQGNTAMRNNETGSVALSAAPGQKREKAIDLIYFKGYSLVKAAEELGITIAELKLQIRTELKNSRGVQ